MLRNYFKTAWRSLWKSKGFSAINIFGLAIGISTCLLIMLYVIDELGYDRYNAHAENIYRIDYSMKFGDNRIDGAQSSNIIGPAFSKEYPQILAYTRMRDQGGLLIRKGNANLKEDNVIYADSTLFSVFTLPFVAGSPSTALKEPHSLVITETTAKKYFNTADAVGKTLLINNKTDYKVTGVIKDFPRQSHFNFDFFVPMAQIEDSRGNDWLSQNYNTYLVLKPGTDIRQIEKEFNRNLERNAGVEMQSVINLSLDDFKKGGGYIRCSLTPLLKIHLSSHKSGELGTNGNIQYVYIFSAIALFILLIACVNFMNLTTAHSANRAREVGVRKVLGSLRKNLIAQFLAESLLVSLIALAIAILTTLLLLPWFNQLAQKNIPSDLLLKPYMLPAFLGLVIIVGILAGSYPAFYLSSFQPMEVLKGKLAKGFKHSSLRNVLVVFQFSISIILIIGTVVIFNQLNYIRSKDIGFSRDQVLVVKNTYALNNHAAAFKNDLRKMPDVKNVTVTGYMPINGYRNNTAFFHDLSFNIKNAVSMQMWDVDPDYIPTMQMQVLKGRNFSADMPTDSNGIIINEAAAKFFQGDPLNKPLYSIYDLATKKISSYHVIGVMKNFNFNTLHEQVTPLALEMQSELGSVAIRVSTAHIAALVDQVKAKWNAMVPGQPFMYTFLDEDFNKQYVAEQRTGKLAITFSVLAILIASLGLFGLATYAAEQRVKEIGIRKVLGANVPDIMGMLSKDFVKLVLIAILIASPVAWWAMNRWLQDFAYRVPISWWIFLMAGSLALIIALATISFQAIKAAYANPVNSLRSE